MPAKVVDGLLEAGRSAGDLLEDLKELYDSVRSLHENLMSIQDAIEELIEDGFSVKLLFELVRVVQEDGPELKKLIVNAAGVLKDAWKHRHIARSMIPWCDKKNKFAGEELDVEEAEELTKELRQVAKEVEKATLPLLKAMDTVGPVQRIMLNGESCRGGAAAFQAHSER
jgi:hypothetical protein